MDFTKFKSRGIPGTPLAEIFSIIINPNAEECKLYGTIRVDDNEGVVAYLVNWGPKDPQHISSDSSDRSIILDNNNRAILANSHFTVHFDLKDLTDGDSEFIKESFIWMAGIDDDYDDDYDKILMKTIVGKRGSAIVYYTVHHLAMEAHIGVKVKERVQDSLHFEGTITARYKSRYDCDASEGLKEHSQVTVFWGGLYDSGGKIFPLDRSVVTLPCYTSLVIQVDLRSTEGGEVLWKDEVEFEPKRVYNQRIDQDIEGTYGSLRLSVCAIDYARDSFANVEVEKNDWLQFRKIPQRVLDGSESDDESLV